MKIKNKAVLVYDIEVFPNLFTCTLKNTETQSITSIVISEESNYDENISKLYVTFNNGNYIFCGYNNIHYDDIIINYILSKYVGFKTHDKSVFFNKINSLNKAIIEYKNLIPEVKKYKYKKPFKSFDLLTMLYSSKLRVGLKELQITMQFHNVEEYDGDFNKPVDKDDVDKVLKYNLNDVLSTEELLNRCKERIDLRLGIEEEYGVNVLSSDDMSIGNEILKHKYLEASNKTWNDIKNLRTPCDVINLGDVIFDTVQFKTKQLQDLLTELKQTVVTTNRKSFEKKFTFYGSNISFGVGGLHSIEKPKMFIPNENQRLLDSDVNSLYPSLIISYGLVPKHLGKEFLDIYSKIRDERLYAKKNKLEVKNQALKLALNGATGNYQNEYSWLYDPVAVFKIRINGQLFLLMLAETLVLHGATLGQLNTDGVLYLIDKDVNLEPLLKEWEQQTHLTLETDEFERFYQYAINDYVGVLKGYSETKNPKLIKKKGLFVDKITLGKGMQPLIIPKSINNLLVNNIPITETLYESKDINDFITYQKVGKQFDVQIGNDHVTHINRFYMSTDGKYLNKIKTIRDDIEKTEKESKHKISATSGVTICNNLDLITEFPTNINYNYYIKEIKKITDCFTFKQLSLFYLNTNKDEKDKS